MKDYFVRVLTGEHVRRGGASALAGLVVGIIAEALWPTPKV